MTEALYCPNCGARQQSLDARFCYRCGQLIPGPGESDAGPGGARDDVAYGPIVWPGEEPPPTDPAYPGAGGYGVNAAGEVYAEPGYGPAGTPTGASQSAARGAAGDAYGGPREAPPAGGPPGEGPPSVAVYDAPPPKRRWLLPLGLALAALLAFVAWRGVQAVVGPPEPRWTPGPTAAAGAAPALQDLTLTPGTLVSRARPATATATLTTAAGASATATLPPAPTATPSPQPSPTIERLTATATPAPPTATAPAAPTAAQPAATQPAAPASPPPAAATDRLLAYVSEQSGSAQIWVAQGDGKNARQVTSEGANRSPAWAPDNRSLFYVSERGDRSGIYRIDLASGREEVIAAAPGLGRPQPVAGRMLSAIQQDAGAYRLVLGDRVVFELNRPFDYHWLPDGSQVLIDPLADPREIYKVDIGTGETSTVAAQRSWNASWGPAGQILFVSNNPGVAFVFIADNNGENPRRVSPGDKWAQAPAWSPDGASVAYVAGDGPAWNVYRIGVNGSGVLRLAEAANPDKSPAWEPNSRRLAFESNAKGNWDIRVVDMNGSALIVAGSAANEYDPVWAY